MNNNKQTRYILESCESATNAYIKSVWFDSVQGIWIIDLTGNSLEASKYKSAERANETAWFVFERFNHRIEVVEVK